jgi:hypothetical protein
MRPLLRRVVAQLQHRVSRHGERVTGAQGERLVGERGGRLQSSPRGKSIDLTKW